MATKAITGINPLLKVLGLLIIVSVLLPPARIVFSFKPDLPLLLTASVLLFTENKVARFPLLVHFKVLAALLFISMLLSDNIGNITLGKLDRLFIIPTEFMQVLSRILAFYVFVYIGYFSIISRKLLDRTVTTVFLCAMTWGLLQITDIALVQTISLKLYAMSDLQKNVLESSRTRIFGTAGNSITWGGLSAMMFYYFFFLKKKGNQIIRYLGIAFSIVNIIFSSSRAALFALVLSFIAIQFFIPFFKKKGPSLWVALGRNLLFTIIGSVGIFIAAVVLAPDRVFMIVNRIDNTQEDLTEEGRGGQLNYFIDLFSDNEWNYIMGIGKPALDSLRYMEMEPFFLLFAYGVVGVILHYLILVVLIGNTSRLRQYDYDSYFFITASTLFYFIFSFGFFFFREVISGLPFWWLCGYLVGTLFKMKHERSMTNKELNAFTE